MAKIKKSWVRPRMIILCRNKTNERVLENCKMGGVGLPNAVHTGCDLVCNRLTCAVYGST
jgi:hypothetical protein